MVEGMEGRKLRQAGCQHGKEQLGDPACVSSFVSEQEGRKKKKEDKKGCSYPNNVKLRILFLKIT